MGYVIILGGILQQLAFFRTASFRQHLWLHTRSPCASARLTMSSSSPSSYAYVIYRKIYFSHVPVRTTTVELLLYFSIFVRR